LKILDFSPDAVASYVIPVRSGQWFAFSFLQPTPRGANLAVQLVALSAEPARDFNPQVSVPCRAHQPKKSSPLLVSFFLYLHLSKD